MARHEVKLYTLWRRVGVVLFSWLLLPGLMICYPAEHWQGGHMQAVGEPLGSDFSADRMGSFAYADWDAERECRPLHSIRFDEFSTESGQFGFFRTGMYRTARMTGLRLKLYSYSADGEVQPGDVGYRDVWSTRQKDILGMIEALIRNNSISLHDDPAEHGTQTNVTISVNGIDAAGIGEIKVRDFYYELFDNGDKIVSIRSSLTHFSYGMEDIILRGHVTIGGGDGDTLESNHVYWNSEKERFRVEGNYVLTRGANKFFGRDIVVDMNLNEIFGQRANLDKKEDNKCSRM